MKKDDFCINDDVVELRCKKCNMKIMEYMLQHDDDACALSGISLKCSRCKRVIMLMKYTEAIIKQDNVIANGKMVKKI